MPLNVVNTFPGEDTTPLTPGEPVQAGLKAELTSVSLGSLRVDIGISNLVTNPSSLPENDASLAAHGASVSVETSERRRPATTIVSRSLSSGAIKLSKTNNDASEIGIYEISSPIEKQASVMAYVKLRRRAWTTFNPDWCNLSNMVGFYLAMEFGPYNTGIHLFLRDSGANGTAVMGGPLQTFSTARPGQAETPFAWKTVPIDSSIEFWLVMNQPGLLPPFSPAYTPIFEVWAKRPADSDPVTLFRTGYASIGAYPAISAGMPNFRTGPENLVRLFFGNAGRSGDDFYIEDWAIYPDYSVAVLNGEALANHEFVSAADGPSTYEASSNATPDESVPGKWMPLQVSDPLLIGISNPQSSLYYQPGRMSQALFAKLPKDVTGLRGYQKREPILETLNDGIVMEGLIAGLPQRLIGTTTGMGMGVEDGTSAFVVVMTDDGAKKSLSLLQDRDTPLATTGYHSPSLAVDFTTLKLVRLVVDRYRDKVLLFADETKLLDLPIGSTFPAADIAQGRVFFGHLQDLDTAGELQVAKLSYLVRYKAWEGEDDLVPSDAGIDAAVRFDAMLGGTSSTVVMDTTNNRVVINKSAFNSPGTFAYYRRIYPFPNLPGFQIDFKARVKEYTNAVGEKFAPYTNTGVGLQVFLGSRVLRIGFYDAGAHGRVVGITPESGDVDDIINQTLLGRKFSFPIDWTEDHHFRLVHRPFDKIELYVDNIVNSPVIVIPWRDDVSQFDLALDNTASKMEWGHLTEGESSISEWSFFRWGYSSGYEVATTKQYPNGFGKHVFGGRSFVRYEYDEA